MRILACTIILVFLCSPIYADNWTDEDTVYQLASTAIQIVDWSQTRYIAKHPQEYYEMNPILGRHPSTEEVNQYFITSVATKAIISYWLPPAWRRAWQIGNIGLSTGLVIRNTSIGIKVKF